MNMTPVCPRSGRQLRVVVAVDSMKGSLSAAEVAAAGAIGARKGGASEVWARGVADGGEGTLDVGLEALGGRELRLTVTGPYGRPVTARIGVVDSGGERLALIEMAQGCGYTLAHEGERDVCASTSRGLGEMMLAAWEAGCRRFMVGIGGSATNDGGAGMLRALGVEFYDEQGCQLAEGGEALLRLARIDLSHARRDVMQCPTTVVCDVDNPLCGPRGASAVFGPQKGATPEMVSVLDKALERWGVVAARTVGRDFSHDPGAGAAGGVGMALMAFFNSHVERGIDAVLAMTGVEEYVREADLVITGEGCMDRQTLSGKAPTGVLAVATRHNVPVVGIAGKICDRAALLAAGFRDVVCINKDGESGAEAMRPDVARHNVVCTVEYIVREFRS